ncbi:CerR family C-terminal domain-containing protein [Pseudomonas silvicola]|nr:CerR family C-terminal domain-containing protein [Pseudomonas silvicola]
MSHHRSVHEGGYLCGENTRREIIEAALAQFALHGFEGASIRGISKAAGVKSPAVHYYFRTKEGLYTACMNTIIERIWDELGDRVCTAEALLAQQNTHDDFLIEAYLEILSGLNVFSYDTSSLKNWQRFMAREQTGLGPEPAFDLMQKGFYLRLIRLTRSIVGRLTGHSVDDETTIIRTLAFNCQSMLLGGAGPLHAMSKYDVGTLQRILSEQNRATLRALVQLRNSAHADGG